MVPSGLRLKSWLPQFEQKHFSKPSSGGFQPLTSSSPWTKRSEPGAMRACGDAAVPVRRWQRVQWQYVIASNGAVIS
jgi:hypothetical protein